MTRTKQVKSRKSKKSAPCTIPPELPKEQLHKLMFHQPGAEVQSVRDYVEWQSRRDNEKVLHAEKVASERVMGREYDVWDVHTDSGEGRWWVVTNPTNLYSQRLMPSMDYVLSFHIGLMLRVEAHREPVGSEAEQELLLVTNRKLVQAGETLDSANEAEDFQAVGMHCRECLLALVRELSEGGDFDEGDNLPKKSDFKAWAERIAGAIASGGSAERVRSFLKKISDETWQLTNWLTHAANATRSDAMLALAATENVITSFVPIVLRARINAPERCGRCKSYRLAIDWRPEAGPLGAYVMRCEACGAEAIKGDEGSTDEGEAH
jgi:predicted Zn-ribbon and HTH transcriptional regulator